MYDFLWNLGSFVVALGLLITAHEYGHFYVARRCGVKVERFSIGFGKAIWRRMGKDGTEYVLAIIPLGGYVKMLDERVEEVPDELKDQAFNRKSVWQRIAIVLAGPMANFIFAIFALYVMYLVGVPTVKPIIDSVQSNTPAAVINTAAEPQQIIAVSGQKVRNWEEVNLALAGHIGDKEISLTLVPLSRANGVEGSEIKYQLDTENWKFDPEKESPIRALGLNIYRPAVTPDISLVSKGSAAAKAGLEVGDTLLSVDNHPYENWQNIVSLIQDSANKPLVFTVMRNGQRLELVVTPQAKQLADGKTIGIVGISPTAQEWPENMRLNMQYGIFESLGVAADKTWQLIHVSVKMIGKLFTGDISVKNLSGPISIAQGAGHSANYGLVYFLSFLALISVNLGIVNLLPVPVLDGGHLLFYSVEALTGKPVPEKIQEVGYKFGAAMLLMLMSIALFNDFSRL